MTIRPKLLILSHVLPFPGFSGQQKRVYFKLKSLRSLFHLTFLTTAPREKEEQVKNQLLIYCDEVITLPSRYWNSSLSRIFHKVKGSFYALRKGLKFSNYLVGELEFTPQRIKTILGKDAFQGVLFEYWHAFKTVHVFHQNNIPCVLDMHNVLWQSYSRQLSEKRFIYQRLSKLVVEKYKMQEEAAWRQFDGLIAINQSEYEYVKKILHRDFSIFFTPMGIDLEEWPYSWQPASPPRIAYYGGMGSAHNQHSALTCYQDVMPIVWARNPDVEFWIVGANPPDFIRKLDKDARVTVTGFVDTVQELLRTMSLVLCPWSGTYGFRSRLVEAMGLGVPVVASRDAVFGMGLENEQGIFLTESIGGMEEHIIKLLEDSNHAWHQSQLAREQVEYRFSYQKTYGVLAQDLLQFFMSIPFVETGVLL